MRKRTIKTVADTIFWYGLYFLPIIAYLLYLYGQAHAGQGVVNYGLQGFFSSFEGISLSNPIAQALSDIFSVENGFIPVFNGSGLFYFFSWFIYVYLMHLMVDFVLFIPRLAHKWMNAFTRGDE